MFKKITSLFLAVVLSIGAFAINASAESYNVDSNNVAEVYSLPSITRSNYFTYGDFDIKNGMTMLLGNSNNTSTTNNGCFYIKSGATVTLTTELSSTQTNIDMGYYNNTTGVYTECTWTMSGNYTYTCAMTISTGGYYKFLFQTTPLIH